MHHLADAQQRVITQPGSPAGHLPCLWHMPKGMLTMQMPSQYWLHFLQMQLGAQPPSPDMHVSMKGVHTRSSPAQERHEEQMPSSMLPPGCLRACLEHYPPRRRQAVAHCPGHKRRSASPLLGDSGRRSWPAPGSRKACEIVHQAHAGATAGRLLGPSAGRHWRLGSPQHQQHPPVRSAQHGDCHRL